MPCDVLNGNEARKVLRVWVEHRREGADETTDIHDFHATRTARATITTHAQYNRAMAVPCILRRLTASHDLTGVRPY